MQNREHARGVCNRERLAMTSREELIKLEIAMHEASALAETYQALYEEARKKYHAASAAAYWGRDFDLEAE